MKIKHISLWTLLLVIPLTIGIALSGCKKDDDEDEPDCPTVDKTELAALIDDAQQMHDDAVEGTNPGEYTPGSKEALQSAIDLAQQVHDKNCVTQAELDAAEVSLQEAMNEFADQMITDVAPEALVAQWLFNGDAMDASGNGHDGTVSAGHENWGAGMPMLDTDRHGNAEYCYKFQDGGNIVVPQDPAFAPAEITISVWMKLYETWAHSYFISNDIWHCWKFQVQDANKPFFTAHITKDDGSGEEAYIDKDANTGILELDTWHHVVMTYKSGLMTFYVDGVKTQEWSDFPTGTFIAPHAGIDLCIGQALATDDFDDGDHEWKEWLGFFKGWLDDLRLYNVVLTDAQVTSLYNYEMANTIE